MVVKISERLRLESSGQKSVPRTIEYRKISVQDLLEFPGWETWTEEQFLKWYDKPYAVSIAGMKEFPVHSYNKDYSTKKVVMWDPESVPKEVKDFFSSAGGEGSKILSNEHWKDGFDSSYKSFESHVYDSIDLYNTTGGKGHEVVKKDEEELTAPWTHEKAALLIKKLAPVYGFKVREDPETSYWTGFSAEGSSMRKLIRKWRDFTSDLRRKFEIEGDSQWTHEYQEGRPSSGITTTLSYYGAPDWTFALVVKEKVYQRDRKIWFSLWLEDL